jgi:hypothetical protein
MEEVEREERMGVGILHTCIGITSNGDHTSLNEDERDAFCIHVYVS